MASWVNCLKLPLRLDDYSLSSNYYFSRHEFRGMALIIHIPRNGDLFVDVRAKFYSCSLLASVVSRERSIAFNPVPLSFAQLRLNRELNRIEFKVELNQIF